MTNTGILKVQYATILEGLEYPVLSRNGFVKLILKAGNVFSTFPLPPEVIWSPSYAQGLRYHQPFWGPLRLTNHYFTHRCTVLYNLLLLYLSYWQIQTCGRSKIPQFLQIRNILFWAGRVLQNSHQKLGEFSPHSFSHLMCFDVHPMLGVWDILAQINWTELTMRRSAWPKHWPNVKVTWCTTAHGHQMPLPIGLNSSGGLIIFPCPDHFVSLSVL